MNLVEPTRQAARFIVGVDSRADELIFGHDVGLDGRSVASRLADATPPVGSDLLEIASVVYAVDRRVPRPTDREVDRTGDWGRDIWVEVPVREPAFWKRCQHKLSTLLNWLTDDRWQFEFVQLAPGCGPLDPSQSALFDTLPTGIPPVLFSGGLDSACGLYLSLVQHDAIPVSIDTNTWMQHIQKRVSSGLAAATARKVTPLRFKVCLPRGGSESSQRTRGFLFLSAGVSAALALRSAAIVVTENGIGSINLPCVRSQVGAQATRSMHPRTISLMEDLAGQIVGQMFAVLTPYYRLTKAELLSRVPSEIDDVLVRTVSCDTGFAARVRDHAPCGRCTSCVLRRQAAYGARRGSIDKDVPYRYPTLESVAMSSMLWQVMRLRRCLSSSTPWLGLLEEFPEIEDVEPYIKIDEIVRLYAEYTNEWDLLMEALSVGSAWSFGRDGA